MHAQSLSCARLFVTPWTVARQAPLSTDFSRQESWSGLHFLLQGIFLTQELNPCLLHWRRILYHWATKDSLIYIIGLLIKGKFKHRKNTMEVGEHHVKINAEIRAILWQTEKCQKLPANHQQLGRGMDQILSQSHYRRNQLSWHSDLGLLASKTPRE